MDNAEHEHIEIKATSTKVLSSNFSFKATQNQRIFIESDEKLIFTRVEDFMDHTRLSLQCKDDICFYSEADAKIYMLVLIFMWCGLGWLAFNRY